MNADVERSLSYASVSLINGDLGALEGLRRQCTRHNANASITGALYYDQQMFVQVLEGPTASLHALMRRISRDPRHTGIRILSDEPAARRRFGEWSMKFVSGLAAQETDAHFTYETLINADRAQVEHAATLLLRG